MLAGRSTSKVRLAAIPGGPHRARCLGSSRLPLSGAVCNFALDATVISPSLPAASGSRLGQRLIHTRFGLAGGDQRTVGPGDQRCRAVTVRPERDEPVLVDRLRLTYDASQREQDRPLITGVVPPRAVRFLANPVRFVSRTKISSISSKRNRVAGRNCLSEQVKK
jgi:hypothetical protein